MPGLALDTGKTHEAAGIHITYWQRGRRMAASGARAAAGDRVLYGGRHFGVPRLI
jgi:hypothetical protein